MLNSLKKGKEKQVRQAREIEKLLPAHYGYAENVQMLERFVWHCLLYNIFFYYSRYFKRVIDQIPCQSKKVCMVELKCLLNVLTLKVMSWELL
jgi:hypothetical protein